MKTIRTVAETRTLAAEAEQRARAGESLAAIAHAMGIPTSTLSDWALKGRWRRKDLQATHADEIACATAERVGAFAKSKLPTLKAKLTDAAAEVASVVGKAGHDANASPEMTAWATAHIFLERGMIAEADRAIRLASRLIVFREQFERRLFKK
jgi:transposase-like protein